jgi:hypothetical protein
MKEKGESKKYLKNYEKEMTVVKNDENMWKRRLKSGKETSEKWWTVMKKDEERWKQIKNDGQW